MAMNDRGLGVMSGSLDAGKNDVMDGVEEDAATWYPVVDGRVTGELTSSASDTAAL